MTDRATDRPTNRPRYAVCNIRPHLRSTAMRPKIFTVSALKAPVAVTRRWSLDENASSVTGKTALISSHADEHERRDCFSAAVLTTNWHPEYVPVCTSTISMQIHPYFIVILLTEKRGANITSANLWRR